MAASSARLLPLDTPTPSMAVPELHMMAFTSAKSTLTKPGMVMMSEMPCTPCAAHPLSAYRQDLLRQELLALRHHWDQLIPCAAWAANEVAGQNSRSVRR